MHYLVCVYYIMVGKLRCHVGSVLPATGFVILAYSCLLPYFSHVGLFMLVMVHQLSSPGMYVHTKFYIHYKQIWKYLNKKYEKYILCMLGSSSQWTDSFLEKSSRKSRRCKSAGRSTKSMGGFVTSYATIRPCL